MPTVTSSVDRLDLWPTVYMHDRYGTLIPFYKLDTCDLRLDESDQGKASKSTSVDVSRPSCGQPLYIHAYRYVIFYLLSVFPSHLRLLNGQAKVRVTVIMPQPFCG